VLLVGPIYNADGNEAVDLGIARGSTVRWEGMGTRPNAQGLDLNRDQMKLDSPEGRRWPGCSPSGIRT
jgi:murein tripeptide amidase MpaA